MSNAAIAHDDPSKRRDPSLFEKALFLKAPTEEQRKGRRRTFVASTCDMDSHGDVVEQDWVLERYLKNPVVLWAHDRWSPPIGKSVGVALVAGQLEVEVEFAPGEANPFAEQVWKLVDGDYVRAVSVGFRPRDVRWEVRDGVDVCVCSQNELYEVSVLPIGSNPEALAKELAREIASRVPKKETPMSTIAIEEHNKAIAGKDTRIGDLEKRLGDTEKALETEKAAKVVLEKELEKSRTDLTTAQKRNDELEKSAIESEVDALVGDKIDPADREDYITLRKSSKSAFEKIVAKLPAKRMKESVSDAKTKSAITPPATGRTRADDEDDGESLADALGINEDE